MAGVTWDLEPAATGVALVVVAADGRRSRIAIADAEDAARVRAGLAAAQARLDDLAQMARDYDATEGDPWRTK